jgi:hypothetical protein
MGRIPDTFIQDVLPQGQIAPQRIEASPADFGAQVGATLSQASNDEMQLALRQQNFNNETAVNDTVNNKFFPAFNQMYQKYYSLQGKDAVDQLPNYQQSMRDLVQQTRDGLGNPMQQRMFDQESGFQLRREFAAMGRFADLEGKKWQTQVFQGTVQRQIDQAADKYNDPASIIASASGIGLATSKFYQQMGSPPEYANRQMEIFNNRLFDTIIQRRLQAGDVTGAESLYNEGMQKGFITGQGATETGGRLKPYQEQQQAQAAFSVATAGPVTARIAQTAQNAGIDPSLALSVWSAEGKVTNPQTKNPLSSATGIFQIIDSTWAQRGGTADNRFDVNEQIAKGLQGLKTDQAVLAKDLGRSPQNWEVYLAHQQGVGGAEQLLTADSNTPAVDLVGRKAVTQNGGTADMTAGQFVQFIKGYYDRHAMMYNVDGTPSAQNYQQNFGNYLQGVTNEAEKNNPNNPALVEKTRDYAIKLMGQSLRAQQEVDRANLATIAKGVQGPTGAQTWDDARRDPEWAKAYDAYFVNHPEIHDNVENALQKNVYKAWDPAPTDETEARFNTLQGMQWGGADQRAQFEHMDLSPYYGSMPASQYFQLVKEQAALRKKDGGATDVAINVTQSLRTLKPILMEAEQPEAKSPWSGMTAGGEPMNDYQSIQKYNQFVGQFGQQLQNWQRNHPGKVPTQLEVMDIGRQMLFPNGQPQLAGVQAESGKPAGAGLLPAPTAATSKAISPTLGYNAAAQPAGTVKILPDGRWAHKIGDGQWQIMEAPKLVLPGQEKSLQTSK